jgi:hypothetical protein
LNRLIRWEKTSSPLVLVTMLLITIGRPGAPELRLRVYPGANHDFDTEMGSNFSRNSSIVDTPADR